MRKFLLYVFIGTCFCCCCKKEAIEQDPAIIQCYGPGTADILLNNCSSKNDSASSSSLCFESVEDSRCPLNVQCIWEGVAVGKFSLTTNSTRYPFTLATKKFPGGPSADTTIAGRHITLVNVLPYPGGSTEPTHAILQIQ